MARSPFPRRAAVLALLAGLVALPGPARAAPMEAVYEVRAAGLRVMDVEARFDLPDSGAYAVEMTTRLRGVASWFGSGHATTRVNGQWNGDTARPARYQSEGVWRGEPRRTLLEYPDGQPQLRQLVPEADADREPIPAEARRGTRDSLSVFAQLARNIQRGGRCEGEARVFDGRRLSEMRAVTAGWEQFPASGDGFAGRALRCDFEGRQTGGFLVGRDGERYRRPQRGSAWMVSLRPGTPPVPVRIEMESAWLGSITVNLLGAGAPGAVRPVSELAAARAPGG